MKLEILITADVIDYDDEPIIEMDDESTKTLKKEIQDTIRKAISKFKGSQYGGSSFMDNGVYDTLENVDYEVAFVDDEGIYDYFSKKYNTDKYHDLRRDKYDY